jgi:hypothetical protein
LRSSNLTPGKGHVVVRLDFAALAVDSKELAILVAEDSFGTAAHMQPCFGSLSCSVLPLPDIAIFCF